MGDLRELKERVTAATGPDRELDAEIGAALEGGEIVWLQTQYTGDMYPALRRPSSSHVGGFANEHVPHFCASIDAALALVERKLPGWGWEVHQDDDHYKGPLIHWAAVRELTMAPTAFRCRGVTPPLAILAALLSALEPEPTRG